MNEIINSIPAILFVLDRQIHYMIVSWSFRQWLLHIVLIQAGTFFLSAFFPSQATHIYVYGIALSVWITFKPYIDKLEKR
jgi:hypothetical protein